jgi:hypothetical protein
MAVKANLADHGWPRNENGCIVGGRSEEVGLMDGWMIAASSDMRNLLEHLGYSFRIRADTANHMDFVLKQGYPSNRDGGRLAAVYSLPFSNL